MKAKEASTRMRLLNRMRSDCLDFIVLPIFTRSVTEIPEYRRLITDSNKHGCPSLYETVRDFVYVVYVCMMAQLDDLVSKKLVVDKCK